MIVPYFAYITATGEISYRGTCPEEHVLSQPVEPGRQIMVGEADPDTQRVVDGVLVDLPAEVVAKRRARPHIHAKWDWDLMDWTDSRSVERLAEDNQTTIKAQIAALERQQLRSVRELTIGRGNQGQARQRLEEIDDQIAALRAQLP